jgi:hypothetical protein
VKIVNPSAIERAVQIDLAGGVAGSRAVRQDVLSAPLDAVNSLDRPTAVSAGQRTVDAVHGLPSPPHRIRSRFFACP